MYNSGYSQVNKYSPGPQKKMQYRSKGKSCGYYMRIVFFFSSLIQTLIIVSLVLFLIYGKKDDTASASHVQDLEKSFSQLSIENVALRQQRKNLTNVLNVTLTSKAQVDLQLKKFQEIMKTSILVIQDLQRKNQQCNTELFHCKFQKPGGILPTLPIGCNRVFIEQLNAKLQLVESNFTHTVQRMRIEMDQIVKQRDDVTLETIQLRRDKSILENEVHSYQQKAKDEFSYHLSGVSNVSKAFLQKIDSLFPTHIAFQLTCSKQREHLEQIRTNCTSLSREVEDKLQNYLNIVGNKVTDIQGENRHLKAENWRLYEDYRWCSNNRSGLIQQHKVNLQQLQAKHDEDKERLLIDKRRLSGEIKVLENNITFKCKEVDHLKEQVKTLNLSCMSKTGIFGSTVRGNPPPQVAINPKPSLGSGTSQGVNTSPFDTSRMSGVVGGAVNLTQHLQELQRIINPPGPQKKQDLSTMLG
ncbi:plasmalemma vesicle associated protein a [Betta splendens]|uniref:Plasmalemma vesicle associated protein a n=1 Tax=Betta splendens TaxID=158456 RepID=A0A6P7L438_BETSP|nr:plasmalemma vesicle associated protein a [Betta splendens]